MKEFQVRLLDGRIISVFAFGRGEVPTILEEEEGISRTLIASVRNLGKLHEALLAA